MLQSDDDYASAASNDEASRKECSKKSHSLNHNDPNSPFMSAFLSAIYEELDSPSPSPASPMIPSHLLKQAICLLAIKSPLSTCILSDLLETIASLTTSTLEEKDVLKIMEEFSPPPSLEEQEDYFNLSNWNFNNIFPINENARTNTNFPINENARTNTNSKKRPILEIKEKTHQQPGFTSAARMMGLPPPPQKQQQPPPPQQQQNHTQEECYLSKIIEREIIHSVENVKWDDISGLEHAKRTIKEIVIFPMLRPDIFTGLRGPPKGLLLFGPPGTGKTMIGKCIASQAKATFFSISASSLTSKWVGEGEKLVRCLFERARMEQPAVIFVDEIDSLLTQRMEGEGEGGRRIKTEFLVQFDGASTNSEDKILLIGATNRPQELDEAARRRMVKRLYIPLPDAQARTSIIENLLNNHSSKIEHSLSFSDIEEISTLLEGYSGADVHCLCKEASLAPIRSLDEGDLYYNMDDFNDHSSKIVIRPLVKEDFISAKTQVRASVSVDELANYSDWNEKFGSLSK